jgi:hypothetical protein
MRHIARVLSFLFLAPDPCCLAAEGAVVKLVNHKPRLLRVPLARLKSG